MLTLWPSLLCLAPPRLCFLQKNADLFDVVTLFGDMQGRYARRLSQSQLCYAMFIEHVKVITSSSRKNLFSCNEKAWCDTQTAQSSTIRAFGKLFPAHFEVFYDSYSTTSLLKSVKDSLDDGQIQQKANFLPF